MVHGFSGGANFGLDWVNKGTGTRRKQNADLIPRSDPVEGPRKFTKSEIEEVVGEVKEWVSLAKRRSVCIIPEEGFDDSMNNHYLEGYLKDVGIGDYYFAGDSYGKKRDCEIDFVKMEVRFN
ncbi:hypothetical protein HN903_04585 [archaeon]|jgi:hypothetical protein|nr:hypothetical protein [archaeon]MBT7129005.1 hypothetical protein [archaeon]